MVLANAGTPTSRWGAADEAADVAADRAETAARRPSDILAQAAEDLRPVLFREGEPANTLYVVVDGAVVPIAEGPPRQRLEETRSSSASSCPTCPLDGSVKTGIGA